MSPQVSDKGDLLVLEEYRLLGKQKLTKKTRSNVVKIMKQCN